MLRRRDDETTASGLDRRAACRRGRCTCVLVVAWPERAPESAAGPVATAARSLRRHRSPPRRHRRRPSCIRSRPCTASKDRPTRRRCWPTCSARQRSTRCSSLDDFAHRLAATVDNLGRATASPRLWPRAADARPLRRRRGDERRDGDRCRQRPALRPLAGRPRIGRHGHASAQTYKRLYPQLQKEYENLGYPTATSTTGSSK